ncbi:T9SS type B sorting domain-containing protein [Gaetbulibacter saemankumensis]|uniref:T9SS type B sorting domain-containing protein n=1 Tax=Gaetbulibacter saemankumensis TaxID=311208 RepID=UPI00041EE175|nr:T9SS type B sorting domain-containing protein [Gaetbulibacter saemankumensis]
MKKYLIILNVLLISGVIAAQKESANWYFGNFAGLNFNSGTPTPLLDGQLVTKEGSATISDVNGNLLFYTDGLKIWDRRHKIMPNGYGLKGHVSSTESALIVPKPGDRLRYYVFTVDRPSYNPLPEDPIEGINYSEIDMSLNNGYGDVVNGIKNVHLITYDVNNSEESEFKSSEKITAVSHNNASSVWVITQFMNKFYAFKVDVNGVNPNPVISKTPEDVGVLLNDQDVNISAIGYLKVSPNGHKIAIAHSSTSLGSPRSGRKQSGKVLLYDFDNTTGIVSNEKLILNNDYPYGVEFSPNSKLLYVTVNEFNSDDIFLKSKLYQYDLLASNVADSKMVISDSRNVAGALQLAMDAKIYRAGYEVFKKGYDISVINKPNNRGNLCDYNHNSVNLAGPDAQIGFPVFVQSIFLASFDYRYTCLGDATQFVITSEEPYQVVHWDFGDGSFSSLDAPMHTYAQPGKYKVTLTLTINGIDLEPYVKEVVITEPVEVMTDVFEFIQCDSFDGNPNDGITQFNLQDANSPLALFVDEPIRVYYYKSFYDAVNDEANIGALPNLYTNTVINEVLYAKVYKANTDCFNVASLILMTTQPVTLSTYQLNACVSFGVDIGNFDLDLKRNEIISDLNLTTNVGIRFFENLEDANYGVNELPDVYTSKERVIYVRAESDNACYGFGTMELFLKPFPDIKDQNLKVCSHDFPIELESGISMEDSAEFEYLWSTNDTTNNIQVNQPGEYTVSIKSLMYGCTNTYTVSVKQNIYPKIKNFIIDGHSVRVDMESTDETYMYTVDFPGGAYQQGNVFLNLSEGQHVLYIKDVNSCETISKSFYIFGFPKYFTPNNDGKNDLWTVYGLNTSDYADSDRLIIQIYNRYGKLLKTFNPLQSAGFDGYYRGRRLRPDDYWYFLKMPDGEVYKGHFTLKL